MKRIMLVMLAALFLLVSCGKKEEAAAPAPAAQPEAAAPAAEAAPAPATSAAPATEEAKK